MPPRSANPSIMEVTPERGQRPSDHFARVILYMIVGIILWYILDAITFNPFSSFTPRSLFESFVRFDSYGSNFAVSKILKTYPLFLGALSGLMYYLYIRRRESTLSVSLDHPPSRWDKRGTYLTWFIIIYALLATAGLFWYGKNMLGQSQGLEALVIPFIIGFVSIFVLLVPLAAFIVLRAFAIRNRPRSPAPPLAPLERRLVATSALVLCIGYILYVGAAFMTASQLPRSTTVSDLITEPITFEAAPVLVSSEIAFGIKGHSGLAIRHQNYYSLDSDPDASDYIWTDADAIGSYNPDTCDKPINTATTNLVQWKLREALRNFSRLADTPIEDVRVYDCIRPFIIIGSFYNEPSGPKNRFSMHIRADSDYTYADIVHLNGSGTVGVRIPLDTTNNAITWKTYGHATQGFSFQYPPDWNVRSSGDNLVLTDGTESKRLTISATPLQLNGRRVAPQAYYDARFGSAVVGTAKYNEKPIISVIMVPGKELDQLFFTDDTMYSFHVFTYDGLYDIVQPMIMSFELSGAEKRYVEVQSCVFNCKLFDR